MQPKKTQQKKTTNLRRDENPSNHKRKENTIIYGLKIKFPSKFKRDCIILQAKIKLKLIKNTLILLGISLGFFLFSFKSSKILFANAHNRVIVSKEKKLNVNMLNILAIIILKVDYNVMKKIK